MSETATVKREFEYDVMRVIAAIAVVCIHTCSAVWKSMDVNSSEWLIIASHHIVCEFSVPLFFMISGRFFLDANKTANLKTLLIQKILRLAVAYIFWSFIYMLQNSFEVDSFSDSWKSIVFELVTGEYHMWFLWTIAALYLITPFLKTIAADDKLSRYFLILFIVFQLLLPAAEILPHIGVFVTEILQKTQMQFVMGYSGYYFLGSFLRNHSLSRKTCFVCYVFGLIGVIYSVASVIYSSRSAGVVDASLAQYRTWNVAAETVAVYVFISRMFKNKSCKAITVVSKYSFGIYLSHPLILWVFSLVGFMPNFINPIIGVPIVTAFSFSISLLISMVLRKIPKLGKYIT